MYTATVSSKGSVVIPKELRDVEGLHPGTKVAFVHYAGHVHIIPVPDDLIEASYGFLRDYTPLYPGPSVREELIEEHRREIEQEQQRLEQTEPIHESVCA